MKTLLFYIAIIAICLAPVYGYVLNAKKLINADFEAPYKTEVVRTISLIPIIGIFTGYMDIGEEETTSD